MWQSAADFLLRRLLKALLKRHLKHMLATELDVEQLRCSLGKGSFELHDVLLSSDWLAAQAPPGLEVVSGYVGRLALELAVTSLTCTVQLENVLLTVRPAHRPAACVDPVAAGDLAGVEQQEAAGCDAPAAIGLDDGVRVVAAGLETLLQRMTVNVSRLSVRLEGAPGVVACISCAQADYGTAAPAPDPDQVCATASTARRVSFTNLCLVTEDNGPSVLAPFNGELDIAVSWPLDRLPGHQPHVSVRGALGLVQLQLRPRDVATMTSLAQSYTAAAAVARQPALQQAPQQPAPPVFGGNAGSAAVSPLLCSMPTYPVHPPASASLLEDLMLPGCETLVQEALLESTEQLSGQEADMDDFFDARSLLGSLQQVFSSAMASSVTSAAGSTADFSVPCDLDLASSTVFAMHDLAASVREVGVALRKRWAVSVVAPAIVLAILYQDAVDAGVDSAAAFAPRLVVEVQDVVVAFHTEPASDSRQSSVGCSTNSLSLSTGMLEVAEHLPFPSTHTDASSSSAARDANVWVPAEEMARVPTRLPSAQCICWAVPTFAGDYPLPGTADAGLGIGSTVAQLSSLSQATIYQSAHTLGTDVQRSIACEDAAPPRVQIVPVLCCGSKHGPTLVVHCAVPAAKTAQEHQCTSAVQDVTLVLQPVTVWLTLPLLGRLQDCLLLSAAPASPAQASRWGPAGTDDGSGSTFAVEAAMHGTLLHEPRTTTGFEQAKVADAPGPLRLSVFLAAACIIVAVPAPTRCEEPPCLPRYLAIELQSGSDQLLASVALHGTHQNVQALTASLHASCGEPMVTLRQDGRGATPSAAIRIVAACMHALTHASANEHPSDSLLGPALMTAEVARWNAPTSRAALCLSIDVFVRPPISTAQAEALERLWAVAAPEPGDGEACWFCHQSTSRCCCLLQCLATCHLSGCDSDQADLYKQITANARLLVTISAQEMLLLTLDLGMLTAAALLADGLLQLSTVPPPMEAAIEAAVLLECEVQCALVVSNVPVCSITARSIHAAACSSIGGVAGSSAAAIAIGSVEITRAEPHCAARVLLHVAAQTQADGRRLPAAQLLVVLRPTGEDCVLCSNGRFVLPTHGRVSAHIVGLTVMLGSKGDLSWMEDLRSLVPIAGCISPGARVSACPPDSSLRMPPARGLDWVLTLTASSARYEPHDAGLVAAVLSVSRISWRSGHASSINARRLALHLAAAASGPASNSTSGSITSGSSSGGRQGQSVQLSSDMCPAPTTADATGFHQVASESGIAVHLPARPGGNLPGGQAAVMETIVTNEGLNITLSRHTLLLLQRLARQLAADDATTACVEDLGVGSGEQCPRAPLPSLNPCDSSSAQASSQWQCPGPAVNVMAGVVQTAYASSLRPTEHPCEASVFLDGGWYDPGQTDTAHPYIMSPAGSPPEVMESWMDVVSASRSFEEQQGVWYSDAAADAVRGPEVLDEYVALSDPGECDGTASLGGLDYDCRILPPDHSNPDRRISFRGIAITVTLADTFTTVLLPEDDSDWPLGEPPLGSEEERVPVNAQVQARLDGVNLQLDSFAERSAPQREAPCPSMRCALVIGNVEVRDSFQPRRGGTASATATAATGWSDLRRMLGYHASPQRLRGSNASMVQVAIEAIRADPGADLEYRMQAQLLPLLLHLDQAALAFLQHLLAPASAVQASNLAAKQEEMAPAASGSSMFFQRCEVQPFTLTINYRPHRVDLAALSSGQLAEVLNLVPWGGVSLQFRHLRLFGMQGIGGVGTAMASAYIEDIARFQAHLFVGGIAPIKSICRVSAAAAQLLAIPTQQLYRRSTGSDGSLSLAALTDTDFRRQMQRGLAGFVRAVTLEALNLGATIAAGAEVALVGESSASHTAGMKQALRQASAHLRSSVSGPRSAAAAAATAVRTALLGARNTLDREHTIERRLNS